MFFYFSLHLFHNLPLKINVFRSLSTLNEFMHKYSWKTSMKSDQLSLIGKRFCCYWKIRWLKMQLFVKFELTKRMGSCSFSFLSLCLSGLNSSNCMCVSRTLVSQGSLILESWPFHVVIPVNGSCSNWSHNCMENVLNYKCNVAEEIYKQSYLWRQPFCSNFTKFVWLQTFYKWFSNFPGSWVSTRSSEIYCLGHTVINPHLKSGLYRDIIQRNRPLRQVYKFIWKHPQTPFQINFKHHERPSIKGFCYIWIN